MGMNISMKMMLYHPYQTSVQQDEELCCELMFIANSVEADENCACIESEVWLLMLTLSGVCIVCHAV